MSAGDQLLQHWASLTEGITALVEERDRVLLDLHSYMKEHEADIVESPTVVAEMKYQVAIRAEQLRPLLELLSDEEQAAAYTPPGSKVVEMPEKWDLRVLKGLRRRGGEVKKLIDISYSRWATGPKLKLKEPPHERASR